MIKIEEHFPLVTSIIKKSYSKVSIEFDDLQQIGRIGLAIALKKYDDTKGCKFSTHAYNWINSELSNAVKYETRKKRVSTGFVDSIDREFYSDSSITIRDTLTNECNVFNSPKMYNKYLINDSKELIKDILENGTKREKLYLLNILGELTQDEVAEKLGHHETHVNRCVRNFKKELKLILEV